MKRIGYLLGACSFVWLLVIGGIRFSDPFLKNATIVLWGVLAGIAGLLCSYFLVCIEEEKERTDYSALIEGRKSSLLRAVRRIKALKR